jgi:DNA-binding winged helix-turn-helix (wHTH) protein
MFFMTQKKLTCILTVSNQRHIRQDVLYLDVRPAVQQLRRNLHVLPLPPKQFRLMQALMTNYPTPMTHWELFYWVWGEGTQGCVAAEDGGPLAANSCIEQLVRKLRLKLAAIGLTVHSPRKGYGYEISEEARGGEVPAHPPVPEPAYREPAALG